MTETTWWTVPIVGWSDDGPSPQERGRATRHALLLEAARAFDARGYHAASLSDILAAAGRTKGALYFHFRSKRALAEALFAEIVGSWDMVRATIAERGLDPLRTLMVETDSYVSRWSHDIVVRGASKAMNGPDIFASQCRAWFGAWDSVTSAHLRAADELGLLRPGIDTDRVSRLVVAASAGHYTFAETMPGPPDYFARMTDTWLGVLPAIADGSWLAELWASGWEHRGATDPDCYTRARLA